MKSISNSPHRRLVRSFAWGLACFVVPLCLAIYVLGMWNWDLSVPLIYSGGDDIWQLVLTKVLHETGWVLTIPSLGAPGVASWHHNAAAQTSALHSVLMLLLSPFIKDPVKLQQTYYLLNFPLICATSYIACRLLGVARLLAFCVGMLFAFTTFRLDELVYAFLANYFTVPLAIVAVIWIISGEFRALLEKTEGNLNRHSLAAIGGNKKFLLGLLFVALVAASDGYYSFFTLLLLGFALLVRIIKGDWRRPASLVPAGVYIATVLGVTLSLMAPLNAYKNTHLSEFYPNGVEDPSLIKHPFEAEVYSSTLKMMIAPVQEHRIKPLGDLGKFMVKTSDGARKFENRRTFIPLGTLCTVLFVATLLIFCVPSLRRDMLPGQSGDRLAARELSDSFLSLALFIFLCSIVGGVGTLVALVFPTIRAYERFPLFLIFLLYFWAAWLVTWKLRSANSGRKFAWLLLAVVVTVVALWDQIPRNVSKGSDQTRSKFLAERDFVKKVEAQLPSEAMVYQYPYSQYMRQNKYYGWGSFLHVRFYLHSSHLRWSNGGAKNSAADDWNLSVSELPLEKLSRDLEAVGFSGFMIDRGVLKDQEYDRVRSFFKENGYELMEDDVSKLGFVKLKNPGYRLQYDPSYLQAERIVVTDPAEVGKNGFADAVNGIGLTQLATGRQLEKGAIFTRIDHPEVFTKTSALQWSRGRAPISPLSEMSGNMVCNMDAGAESVTLTLSNQSDFDWGLDSGPLPIRIGVHVYRPDGTLENFDTGFRVGTDAYVQRGTSRTIKVPMGLLRQKLNFSASNPIVAQFAVLQESHAWFGEVKCSLPLQ